MMKNVIIVMSNPSWRDFRDGFKERTYQKLIMAVKETGKSDEQVLKFIRRLRQIVLGE